VSRPSRRHKKRARRKPHHDTGAGPRRGDACPGCGAPAGPGHTCPDLTARLTPGALQDLQRSGLTNATMLGGDFRALTREQIVERIGATGAAQVIDAYRIPYPTIPGGDPTPFDRVKLIPPIVTPDGSSMKYHQRPGTMPRLYFAPLGLRAREDPTVSLLLTEGEKKSLAGDQAGLAAVAIGGLWSWMHQHQPIPDLDRIDWADRPVQLVPDSDVWTRPKLQQAVFALGKDLEDRGARVVVVKLPAKPETKVGLDDYLVDGHTIKHLRRLPTFVLKDRVWAKAAAWHREWKKRRETGDAGESSAEAALASIGQVTAIHPAQDVIGDTLVYGIATEAGTVFISSNQEALLATGLPRGVEPKPPQVAMSRFSREAIETYLREGGQAASHGLLDALTEFFERFIRFRDARLARLVAAWGLATYVFRVFMVFPYLQVGSPEKRCGKTRLLKLLALLGFNCPGVTTRPTEASLFRETEQIGGAQIYDEMEGLKPGEPLGDMLGAVLNAGFEAGGTVPRTNKDTGQVERFNVYAPRALAAISGFRETLEDRVIPVVMARKRRDEPVERLSLRRVRPEAQALRDRCYLFALSNIRAILATADTVSTLLESRSPDDRATELWEPLLTVARVADALDPVTDGAASRAETLLALAQNLGGVRDAGEVDSTAARLAQALPEIWTTTRTMLGVTTVPGVFVKDPVTLAFTPEALLDALHHRPGWAWIETPKALATTLRPYGLYRRRIRDPERRDPKTGKGTLVHAYLLDETLLADLAARYGPATGPVDDETDEEARGSGDEPGRWDPLTPDPGDEAPESEAAAIDGQPVDPRWDRKPLADLLKGISISRTGAAGPVIDWV
jgi:hypothetical protein